MLKSIVVDSDLNWMKSLEKTLLIHGFTDTNFYETGTQVISSLDQYSKPFVMVSGTTITDMNPFKLCRSVRNISPKSGIIMISTHNSYSEQEKVFHNGADYFLHKPLIASQIVWRMLALSRRLKTDTQLVRSKAVLNKYGVQLYNGYITSEKLLKSLPEHQYVLLEYFLYEAPSPITIDELQLHMKRHGFSSKRGSIITGIHRLNKKLKQFPIEIVSYYQLGYGLRISNRK